MTSRIKVGISDYKVSGSPDVLMTLGLGSCVGIAIYDPKTRIGGLSHIMLPDSTPFSNRDLKPEKFADLAIPLMVSKITNGKFNIGLIAKIAGGASMFNFSELNMCSNIGERNVLAVKEKLKEMGIPIIASHTGGNIGRTMVVNLDTFEINIMTANKEITKL